jgi:hypothetical protein
MKMQRKSRDVRLFEGLFGSILGFALVMLLGGALIAGLTVWSAAVASASVLGISTLLFRAWRK